MWCNHFWHKSCWSSCFTYIHCLQCFTIQSFLISSHDPSSVYHRLLLELIQKHRHLNCIILTDMKLARALATVYDELKLIDICIISTETQRTNWPVQVTPELVFQVAWMTLLVTKWSFALDPVHNVAINSWHNNFYNHSGFCLTQGSHFSPKFQEFSRNSQDSSHTFSKPGMFKFRQKQQLKSTKTNVNASEYLIL